MTYLNQINPILFTLFIFGGIILISFLSLLISGDSNGVKQKVLGGLAVFSVALISENSYIIFASLFIGGLIIASEQFMKDLAGILRADSKDIKDILHYANASPEEIKEKNKEENRELEIIQQKKELQNPVDVKKRIENREKIEKMVFDFLPKILDGGWKVLSNVKVVSDNGVSIVVDGILKNDLNPSWTTYVLEIKYLSNFIHNKFIVRRTIESFTGKILSKIKNANISIVLVGDDLTDVTVNLLKEEIKHSYPTISLAIFSWNTQKEIIEKVDKKEIGL
jgi:hypothetical protein